MSFGLHPLLYLRSCLFCLSPLLAGHQDYEFRRTNLDEDDRGANGKHAVELDQHVILGLVAIAVQVDLFDAFDCQILVSECHFIGAGREFVCIADDVLGECC